MSDRVNEVYQGELFDEKTQQDLRERIHWMCRQATGTNILDVGCSQGTTTLLLARDGYRVTGIDVDSEALAFAESLRASDSQIVQDNCNFVQEPFLDYTPSEEIDCVIMGEVIEHVSNPERFISKAFDLLTNDGTLILTTPLGLFPHDDHKHTFYISNFLQLTEREFSCTTVEIIGGRICFVGQRRTKVKANLKSVTLDTLRTFENGLLDIQGAHQDQRAAWVKAREQLQNRISTLLSREKNLTENITKLEAALAKERSSLSALSSEAESLGSVKAELQKFQANASQTESQLQAELSQLKSQQRDSAYAANEAAMDRDMLLAQVKDLITGLSNTVGIDIRDLTDLQQPLDALRALRRLALAVDEAVMTSKTKLQALESSLEASQSKLIATETNLTQAEQDASSASKNVSRLEQQIEILTNELQTAKESETDVRARLERLSADLGTTTAETQIVIADLEESIDAKTQELEREKQAHEAIASENELKLSAANEKQTQLSDQLKTSRRNIEALKKSLSSKDEEISKSQKELIVRDQLQRELREQVDALRAEHQLKESEFEQNLKTLRTEQNRKEAEAKQRFESLSSSLVQKDQALRDADRIKSELLEAKQSVRWRVGSTIAEAATSPSNLLKLPVRLLRLARSGREKSAPPALASISSNGDQQPIKIAAVMDEFSYSCFAPEADLLTFTPSNWRESLEGNQIDLLIVESAWSGNSGSWQYRVASYQKNMGDELLDLLEYCNENNIPTVFWNKEDPVHFDRFIDSARRFDYVLTTDDGSVKNYVTKGPLPSDHVSSLAFAAQPQLHNPIGSAQREHNVCFAGTYYASRHEQRRGDMEILLKPALEFGLHIFDRRYGYAGKDADQFTFPDIYQSAIKGRLEYADMVKAYKKYRVFLNVNSVTDSGTMFSRRVFELLASGTPVISTYSRGIENLLGDAVFFTEREADTREHLTKLLHDDDYWRQKSIAGWRKVLTEHTYSHRLKEICDSVGIDLSTESRLAVVSLCREASDIRRLSENLERQKRAADSIVVFHDAAAKNIVKLINDKGWIAVPKNTAGYLSASKFLSAPKTISCVMGNQSRYGQHYLSDALLVETYSGSNGLMGKHSYHSFERGLVSEKNPGFEHALVSSALADSLVIKSSHISAELLRAVFANSWFKMEGTTILGMHSIGHIVDPSGSVDPASPILMG